MRHASRLARVIIPLGVLVVTTLVLTGPVLGQGTAGKKSGELSDARCYGHHREDGFRSMDLFPTTVREVAKGQEFEFRLTIVTPWLHELLTPYGFVNISGIPGAKFPGEKEPFGTSTSGTLAPANAGNQALPPNSPTGPSQDAMSFQVEDNATEIVANLVGAPGTATRNVWRLEVVAPSGAVFSHPVPLYSSDLSPSAEAQNRQTVRVPYLNLTEGGLGEWSARVTYVRGSDPTADFDLDLQVYYNLSRSTELLVRGPDALGPREQHTYSFTIVAPPEAMADAEIVYGGKVVAFYAHSDLNADDFGNFTKWNAMTFSVGETTVVGFSGPVIAGPDPGPVMRSYGQILGFTSSFLLVPALVLGGTFGRGSVTLFNKALGSARRRVLWHNSTSYLLLATALLHMYLFLLENFWDWSTGVFWGGLSLASMIGLAVTGAFQRRFVASWGFERWRFTHFSLGTVVIGFVLVHIFVDGSHLSALRVWLEGL